MMIVMQGEQGGRVTWKLTQKQAVNLMAVKPCLLQLQPSTGSQGSEAAAEHVLQEVGGEDVGVVDMAGEGVLDVGGEGTHRRRGNGPLSLPA